MPLQRSKAKPKPEPTPKFSFAFEAIGTAWSIAIYEPIAANETVKLPAAIRTRIEQFDTNYSRFRDDSLVTKMAQKADTYILPEDAQSLFDLYHEFYDITDGAMTPLIGQVLSDAGYDTQYSLKSGLLKTPPKWEAVLEYDFPKLHVKKPVLLDFGAAGKGYLVDIIGQLLNRQGIENFCIDAGGDILYKTMAKQKIRVGLEHPDDPSQVIGIAEIRNQSICGSSGNRRAWEGFNHIINPHSLQSPDHIRALWVVADTALVTDGLATALYFVSPAMLRKRYTFEYTLVRQDYSIEHSNNFPAEFFTA